MVSVLTLVRSCAVLRVSLSLRYSMFPSQSRCAFCISYQDMIFVDKINSSFCDVAKTEFPFEKTRAILVCTLVNTCKCSISWVQKCDPLPSTNVLYSPAMNVLYIHKHYICGIHLQNIYSTHCREHICTTPATAGNNGYKLN